MEIIRGTTPTIKYTFQTVNPADITVAYLTVNQNGATKIEKDLAAGSVSTEGKYIAWTLTQAETLALPCGMVYMMCNWKKEDGTRGASKILGVMITENHKGEVI